ncbi:uncharacterized protein N7529_000407 [Penicillium soppii]|uniref:uncharacterized protein n=1 Tax=Penicillium soppii TaxID=69789 RepID=UPI0025493C43|nr:uncharacterized protein N7529_000407 [Penicillium soppii]KAJ5881735.1 hypothetical protein N7529_000407 [Penicillium soppii]
MPGSGSYCQKFSGSAFSSNVAVPTANFTLHGTPKSWSRIGLCSGKENVQFFCDECGSSLFSRPEAMPGTTLIKTGSLIDTDIKIMAELFVSRRRGYVGAVESAKQATEML